MDIAKMSITFHQHQLQYEASLLTMKKAMDVSESSHLLLLDMLQTDLSSTVSHPTSGQSIDFYA